MVAPVLQLGSAANLPGPLPGGVWCSSLETAEPLWQAAVAGT